MKKETFETQIEKGAAWIGTPSQIRDAISSYYEEVVGFDIASLQVNFNTLAIKDAAASTRLFAEEVVPHFTNSHSRVLSLVGK